MKKIYLMIGIFLFAMFLTLEVTSTNAYADRMDLINAPVINEGQYKMPKTEVWRDDYKIYCRVDRRSVSSSLNSRDLPAGVKIGSLSPGEEAIRLAVAESSDGETWWLIKYWYGEVCSGKAKIGWVSSNYIFY